MPLQQHFPMMTAVLRSLTGRWAKRIYLLLIVLLLAITTAARLRMYFLARKAQTALHALAAIQIDQTTEEQLNGFLPNVERRDWEYKDIRVRNYHVKFTNEDDRILLLIERFVPLAPMSIREAYDHLLVWLGYRFFNFAASVTVEQGKVTSLSYGLANRFTAPRYAGQMGYAISARSFHGFWRERLYPFKVSSGADFSPEYRPITFGEELNILYAADAPRAITDRLFQLNLNCFWEWRGCESARQIAPQLWQDAQTMRQQIHEELTSGKCPDSIIEGRMKYLPDVAVSLLEVTGSLQMAPQEEANQAGSLSTYYKFVEMLRDPSGGRLKSFRLPAPELLNQERDSPVRPATKIGGQVLYFSYPQFSSCRFIPATPSALEIVRRAPVPPKHLGDEVVEGLL